MPIDYDNLTLKINVKTMLNRNGHFYAELALRFGVILAKEW